jgi:hypothetical protein
MPLLPLLVRILLLIAGAFPVLYISTASGEDVQAYCANVDDDDGVKTIPACLVAQARRLFSSLPRQSPMRRYATAHLLDA